jgi:amino acid transporter
MCCQTIIIYCGFLLPVSLASFTALVSLTALAAFGTVGLAAAFLLLPAIVLILRFTIEDLHKKRMQPGNTFRTCKKTPCLSFKKNHCLYKSGPYYQLHYL